MKDLIEIIKAHDKIREIDYTINRLITAEQLAVDTNDIDKAKFLLQERGRLIGKKKRLKRKIEQI